MSGASAVFLRTVGKYYVGFALSRALQSTLKLRTESEQCKRWRGGGGGEGGDGEGLLTGALLPLPCPLHVVNHRYSSVKGEGVTSE